MTRPAEYTRNLIIKAAVSLFAEKGFERSSVRDIVTKARVNQAAINYHFKGKDGLYFEVLKVAFESLTVRASTRKNSNHFHPNRHSDALYATSCGRCFFRMI